MQQPVHFTLILTKFQGRTDLAWVREHLFESTLRYRAWVESLSKPEVSWAAYVEAANAHTRQALSHARDTLSLAWQDQNLLMSFELLYEGSLDVSEDGRMLWVRQAFEDLVWHDLSMALLRNTRTVLLNDTPPTPEVQADLLIWADALTAAMATANDPDSPTFELDIEA